MNCINSGGPTGDNGHTCSPFILPEHNNKYIENQKIDKLDVLLLHQYGTKPDAALHIFPETSKKP